MTILLISTIILVLLAAAGQVYIRKNGASIAVATAAVAYCAVIGMGMARWHGILPPVQSQLTAVGIAYMQRYLQDSQALVLGGALAALNVFVACSIWWRMRLKWFVAAIVACFLLAGCLMSACSNYAPHETLFGTCCAFMAATGYALGLTYEEFCVIGNNYIQTALVLASAVWVCITAWVAVRQQPNLTHWFAAGLSTALALLYAVLLVVVCSTYPPPLELAFHDCVRDLYALANGWHVTYYTVNIAIYIVAFVAAIVANLLARKWIKQSRCTLSVAVLSLHLIAFAAIYALWPL